MLAPFFCQTLPHDPALWDVYFKACQEEASEQFQAVLRRFDGRLQIHVSQALFDQVQTACTSLRLQQEYPTLQAMEVWILEGLEVAIVTPIVAPLVYVDSETTLNQAVTEKVMLFQKGRYCLDYLEAQKLIGFLRKFHSVVSLSYGQGMVTATIVGNHIGATPVCASHVSDLVALGIAALLNESQRTQRFIPVVGKGLESLPPHCVL